MSGPRLSIIPARAATDRALKPRDLQVLCVLGRHTDDLGWCTKSQVKMAEEMGCARSTVFEAIERLVKAGYLERHVQEQANGRDAPHFYRVLLDPVHPNLGALKADETDPETTTPPAGISAPPAGPEPAPPAGPGPAPKNDPFRTTHPERMERERGREGEEGQEARPGTRDSGDERRAVERAFERAWQAWPTSVGDSRPEALRAWLGLSAEERVLAVDEAERYIAALKSVGRRHVISHAVYLREKRWTQLPPRPDPSAPTGPRLVAPWGPLWAELVARALAAGPIEVGAPQITRESRAASYAEVRARFGDAAAAERYAKLGHEIGPDGELLFPPDFEARIWREHVAANGYPKVKRLYQAASEGKSVQLGDGFAESGAAFEAVPVNLKVWGEWKAFFAERGWPWMPHTGKQPVVYFPAGGPDGWRAFEDRIRQSEGKGHHADGDREAAE